MALEYTEFVCYERTENWTLHKLVKYLCTEHVDGFRGKSPPPESCEGEQPRIIPVPGGRNRSDRSD